MNLKHLPDDALLAATETAANREREALSVVLHHIREVDRRRLYSKLKYQSLADDMIRHLKYTEDQTWPRISAMKLLKEIPALEEKINDGRLSLSTLNLAKRAFTREERSAKENATAAQDQVSQGSRTIEDKIMVLERLENLSKREAEKVLREETGVVLTASESSRELSDGTVELKIIVSQSGFAAVKELKGLLAHSNPGMTTGQLFELALRALKEARGPKQKTVRDKVQTVPEQPRVPIAKGAMAVVRSRDFPASVRHHVWMRDQGVCSNCKSSNAVQCEHIIPFSLGGESTIENLKLLCRSCNQRSAIEVYGTTKMSTYLKAPLKSYHSCA